MVSISKLRYGFFVLFIFFLMNSCNSTTNNDTPTVQAEEYPEFIKNESLTAPVTENVKLDSTLKNTSSFHTVEIKQMKFQPNELKLHIGDTVLWINKDITDHDVTEETKKAWTSSKLPIGKSWSKVVEESANYFCSLHVVMKGKLIVE
jgi:plastocyanin